MSLQQKPERRDLDAWRLAYRQIVSEPGDPVDCPSDEDLASLVVDEDDSRMRVALADHVVECDVCRGRWRLLRDLHREAGGPASPRAAARRRVRWAMAAAAVIVLAAAVALLAPLADGPDRSVLRSEDAVDSNLPGAIVPASDATLTTAPRRLTWPPDGDREGEVLVRLLDAEGRELWRRHGPDGAADLPESIRSELEPGESYLWVVDRATDRLGPFWFTLAP